MKEGGELIKMGGANSNFQIFEFRPSRIVSKQGCLWRKQPSSPGHLSVCLRTLSMKGLGVVFTHGKGISTPRVCHKGRQPLINCANHDFKTKYFPFYVFSCLFMFFTILWSTRVFPSLLRILNCDEEIRPT